MNGSDGIKPQINYEQLVENALKDVVRSALAIAQKSGLPGECHFFITFLTNIVTNLSLTDIECCYKVFKKEHINQIEIKENRFGIEPELTIKLARLNLRIFEKGISYYGRTKSEGKKIGIIDGIRAIYCIFRYGLFK